MGISYWNGRCLAGFRTLYRQPHGYDLTKFYHTATPSPRACAASVAGPPPAPPRSRRARRNHAPPRRPCAAPTPSRAAGPRRQTYVKNKARTHLPIGRGWPRLEACPELDLALAGCAEGRIGRSLWAAVVHLEADHICIATRRPCVSGSISCIFSTPDEIDGSKDRRWSIYLHLSIYLSLYLFIYLSI